MASDTKPLIYEVRALEGEIQITIIENVEDYESEAYQDRLAMTVKLIIAAQDSLILLKQVQDENGGNSETNDAANKGQVS